MVEVRLSEERDAAVRRSSFHGIGPQTVRSDTAPQPVLTSYKRLEIECGFQPNASGVVPLPMAELGL
jgi:hypothetical protein